MECGCLCSTTCLYFGCTTSNPQHREFPQPQSYPPVALDWTSLVAKHPLHRSNPETWAVLVRHSQSLTAYPHLRRMAGSRGAALPAATCARQALAAGQPLAPPRRQRQFSQFHLAPSCSFQQQQERKRGASTHRLVRAATADSSEGDSAAGSSGSSAAVPPSAQVAHRAWDAYG